MPSVEVTARRPEWPWENPTLSGERRDFLSRLSDQPISKPPNRRLLQRLGCRDRIISELRGPIHPKRLYQLLRSKIVLGINIPHERQSLSSNSRAHDQVIIRKRWTLSAVGRSYAMGFEPKRPVTAIEVVEQGKCQAIGRHLERDTLFWQIGACDDDEFGSNEPNDFQARVLSQPMPNCQIDRLSLQIDCAGAGLYGNFNIRITLGEHGEPWRQPSRRK